MTEQTAPAVDKSAVDEPASETPQPDGNYNIDEIQVMINDLGEQITRLSIEKAALRAQNMTLAAKLASHSHTEA